MRIPRIYLPVMLSEGATVSLDERASRHVSQVLRLRAGAELSLFDGNGQEHHASLATVSKQACTARIAAPVENRSESTLHITLAQGVSRGERMDYTLQKAVELGIRCIQPLWTTRSQVKLAGERLEKRRQHWQGVVVSACEQCGRAYLPIVQEPMTLDAWLATTGTADHGLLLDHRATQSLTDLPAPQDRALLLAGPEGGLAEEERQQALRQGFIGVRLGPRVLRTETAALAALAAMQTLWGDFR